jgi:hypothetical protein
MLLLKEIFLRTTKLKALEVYLTGNRQALRGNHNKKFWEELITYFPLI